NVRQGPSLRRTDFQSVRAGGGRIGNPSYGTGSPHPALTGGAALRLAEVLDARADQAEPVLVAHPHGVAVRAGREEAVAPHLPRSVHEHLDPLPVAQGGDGAHLAVGEVALQFRLG